VAFLLSHSSTVAHSSPFSASCQQANSLDSAQLIFEVWDQMSPMSSELVGIARAPLKTFSKPLEGKQA